jgi:hypothetical protein
MNSSDSTTGVGLQASSLSCGREEVSMSFDNDARITRLLDQLMNPELTDQEVEVLERKITMLRAFA